MNQDVSPSTTTAPSGVHKTEPWRNTAWALPLWSLILIPVISLSVLVFDLSLPLGVAGGVPYVVLVLVGIWLPRRRHIIGLAVIGSALTVIGYFMSPSGGIPWVVLTNRGLALFAIWVTAFLLTTRKRFEMDLQAARDNLEWQVAERTSELEDKNALVNLLHRAAVAANRAVDVEDAMWACLAEICLYTGWPVGHVYVRSRDTPDRMVPTAIWFLEDNMRFASFKKVTEKTEFKSGEGLPGRIMESGKSLWIKDVSEDPNFPRAKLTEDIGSHTGFGLPVLVGDQVAAVLEFFSTEIDEPGESLLHVVDNIGTQLGRVIERSRTEANLRKLSRAVEQSPSTVVITDTNGTIEYVNPKFTEYFGYAPEEVIGNNPHILKSGETPAETYEDLWRTITAGKDWRGEIINRRKDGTTFWVNLTISPVRNDGGEVTHFVGLHEDATERREAEHALRQAQKMDSLGSLAGGIAHDINNMLVPMINMTSSAIETLPKSRPERSHLEIAVKAAERVKALVLKILAFSRKEEISAKEWNAFELVEENLDLLRSTVPSTVTLNHDLDRDAGMIRIDKSQFSSIMINLASNSLDALEGMTGKLEISLSTTKVNKKQAGKVTNLKTGSYVRISVSDTGKGVDAATLQRVLDPFFTTKEVSKGTGLGLSMVYGIISNHGGALDISSAPGKGARVDVYLPRVGG